MVPFSKIAVVVSVVGALVVGVQPAAAQIGANTPIQSITVTKSSGTPSAGGNAFFSATAILADQTSSTRQLGGGGGSFWSIAWSPQIAVGVCGTGVVSFATQSLNIDTEGAFNVNWSPGTPNTLLASGAMSLPTGASGATLNANLACGNNAATGTMQAVWTGERYEGEFLFNNQAGIMTATGLSWTSSNAAVATIDNRGKAQLHSAGTTTITATYGSLCWQTSPGTAACLGTTSGTYELTVQPSSGGGGPLLTAGPDRTVECASPSGTAVTLQGAVFFTPQTPITSTWSGPFGTAFGLTPTVTVPLGANTLMLTISNGAQSASDSTVITVVDTIAPVIASATADPSTIWPPNGRMVPVTIAASTSDACDAQPDCQIVSVTADDGAAAGDWEVTGPLSLNVRAARLGGGTGRTYTVTIRCADASGNGTTRTVTIVVPHNRGN